MAKEKKIRYGIIFFAILVVVSFVLLWWLVYRILGLFSPLSALPNFWISFGIVLMVFISLGLIAARFWRSLAERLFGRT